MGGESLFMRKAIFMRVNSKTINKLDMDPFFKSMEAATKVIGRTINSMGIVSKLGQMANNTKDTTKKA